VAEKNRNLGAASSGVDFAEPDSRGPFHALRAASIYLPLVQDFRLTVALFGNPMRRDHWHAQLTAALAEQNVQLTLLTIPTDSEPRLLDLLQQHAATHPAPLGWQRTIAVAGIENHTPDAASVTSLNRPDCPFLTQANLSRDLFPHACPCPLLLWLTETVAAAMASYAPDLWDWRSQTFDFLEPADTSFASSLVAPITALSGNTTYPDIHAMRRAEAGFREGMTISSAVRGLDHPETIRNQINLAYALYDMGRYAEAEAVLRPAMDACVRTIGPEHLDTLNVRMEIANALWAQGKLGQAEELYRAMLLDHERVLGPDHPNTLAVRMNLATSLQAQGKAEEAETIARMVLPSMERVLGSDHPDTLSVRSNLAGMLQARGKVVEAEGVHRAVLASRERVLGQDHPDTLMVRMNLANSLLAQGKAGEAERLYRAVLEDRQRVQGPIHPDTLMTRMNLASSLSTQGKVREAEMIERAVLADRERVLGWDHPATLMVGFNLSLTLERNGKKALFEGHLEDARRYFEEALAFAKWTQDGGRMTLGSGHPDQIDYEKHVTDLEQALAQLDR